MIVILQPTNKIKKTSNGKTYQITESALQARDKKQREHLKELRDRFFKECCDKVGWPDQFYQLRTTNGEDIFEWLKPYLQP